MRTMWAQPGSSRLSLAQAVVSANAKSKAVALGMREGGVDEEEGGLGRRRVRVMGREVPVLRRETGQEAEEAVWGLDVDAVKGLQDGGRGRGEELPIHRPAGARAYLMRSFASAAGMEDDGEEGEGEVSTPKKKRKKNRADVKREEDAERQRNVALLLGALDLLYESWKGLSSDELDRRAWGWYVAVRPDVEAGAKGWGAKGELRLESILDLRRKQS